jgi:uncharacterized protein involved in outer membrane biogenesis
VRRQVKIALVIVAAILISLVAALYIVVSSYDFDKLKPHIAEAVEQVTGRKLAIAGTVEVEFGVSPTLVLRDLELQNVPWGSRPDLATMARLDLHVSLLPLLLGHVAVRRVVVVEPVVLIEVNKEGEDNLPGLVPLKAASLAGKALAGVSLLDFREVMIKDGRFSFKDRRSEFVYEWTVASLSLTAQDTDTPLEIEVKGELEKAPLMVSGTLGSLEAFANSERSWPFSLNAEALNVHLSLEGRVRNIPALQGIETDFRIRSENLEKASQFLHISPPVKEPLVVSGHLKDTGPKAFAVSELNAKSGSSDLDGSVDIVLSGAPPEISARLSSNRMDLRPFFSKERRRAAQEKAPEKNRLFPEKRLTVKVLSRARGNARIRAAEVIFPGLAVKNLTAQANVQDGVLRVRPLEAMIGGGNLIGDFTMRSQGDMASGILELKGENLEMGSMIEALGISDAFEGSLDVDIAVTGSGESLAELMGNLDGHTSLIMGSGRIHDKYLNLLSGVLGAGIFRLLNPLEQRGEYTDVNCMVSMFEMNRGIAKSTALVCDTETTTVVGQGDIDLRTERLDFSIQPVPKGGIGIGGLGKLNLSFGELARPFKLKGTLTNPSLSVDTSRAAFTLGKAIGGTLLFGPAGIAVALLSGRASDQNPCLSAIKEAEKGVAVPEKKEGTEEGVTKGISDFFKGLFGR